MCIDCGCEQLSFSGDRRLRDNFKPPIRFTAVKQGLIFEKESEKRQLSERD
jgi:hypothetical protein